MSLLDRETFESWAERIMERFDQSDKMLASLAKNRFTEIDGERLYDNYELCEMLHVSKRSLQRYRSLELLPYQMIRHKTYYKEADVKIFIQNHFDKFKSKQSKIPKNFKR
ncbi:helix-turn-helix domain-containing protein [Bacteroides thetaiotaomicron]|uniref:helix-turn-helix domain-containing protein n=1 Tax=Bacteroides thetaiotaomicron TaxID=818 RepID=UPI001C8B8AEE|nr:helix-turn-helix domain-containing protein [Bacteroides thetaiotaomicron]MBX9049591.1 helix-turn-helix domain-containing protein [Bacteroides thetaiotaomicron]MBX9074241.1 helix-turn-helix domain-containing protein [Bacteroides thetaiotaomicron]